MEILKKYANIGDDVEYKSNKMTSVTVLKRFLPKKKHEKTQKTTVFPEDYMERYEDRPDKLQIWADEGISWESMAKFQVKYDPFSNRIVYPIRNPDGKIVNIGGRTLDPLWKEKKLRKYTYLTGWGTINTLYGLSENMEAILAKREAIVFEGCKSVLLADSYGIKNTCALLTSHLSSNQMKLFAKLGCRVVFALDKEIDVTQDRNINKLKQYVNVEYLFDKDGLLDEKDSPIDKGDGTFVLLYENRRRLK